MRKWELTSRNYWLHKCTALASVQESEGGYSPHPDCQVTRLAVNCSEGLTEETRVAILPTFCLSVVWRLSSLCLHCQHLMTVDRGSYNWSAGKVSAENPEAFLTKCYSMFQPNWINNITLSTLTAKASWKMWI